MDKGAFAADALSFSVEGAIFAVVIDVSPEALGKLLVIDFVLYKEEQVQLS